MSPKTLLLLLGFVAVGCAFHTKDLLNKLHEKQLVSAFSSRSGKLSESVARRRRDTASSESTEITDEDAASLIKFFVAAAWQSDKAEVLSSFLEEMSDSDSNLTVVAWQRILDQDGKVKEIHTLELVIPPKPEDGSSKHDDDDDDEDEEDDGRLLPHQEINEMKEMFEPMAQLGIPASVTLEEFDKDGDEIALLYMDDQQLYGKADGFALYNTTVVASPEEVSKFISNIKPGALGKPSILKYDVDGKFLEDQSSIRPHLLGDVMDHYEAPDNILLEGPQIIAQISQQYPHSEIPKQLAHHYNEAYPEYKWRVLVDAENHFITRDVSITLTYDNFDLYEDSDISYLVYGIKHSK